MELTHELREHAGFQWVLNRLSPMSPFGKGAARSLRWYGPGDEAALEEELADDETAAAPSVNEDAPLSPEQKAPQPPPSEEFAVSTFPEPDQVAPAPPPPLHRCLRLQCKTSLSPLM